MAMKGGFTPRLRTVFSESQEDFLRDRTVFFVGVNKHGIADARRGRPGALADRNPDATKQTLINRKLILWQ
jgi:hypothetical protein